MNDDSRPDDGVARSSPPVPTCTRSVLWVRLQMHRLRRWTVPWKRMAVNLLFPPRCVLCDEDLLDLELDLLLCRSCRSKLATEPRSRCPRCGAVVSHKDPPKEGCDACRSPRLHFDTVVPLASYREEARTAVLRMKHAAGEPLAIAMGDLLGQVRCQQLATFRPEIIVPIPMYWSRRLTRRINSPDILARRLALRLGVAYRPRVLVRRRNTLLQPDLSPPERFRNIQGAFRVRRGYDLGGARVLVVDDVLTTGATCSEATRMLKQAGAASVGVAVVARAEKDT